MDTISTRSAQSAPQPTALASSQAVESEGIAPSPRKPTAKPGLVLRVGVTGHRDLLPTEAGRLQEQVSSVLQQIVRIAGDIFERRNESGLNVYSDEPLVLRMISPLAEGADRLVAEEAIRAGFKLQCPLPFSKDEYEKDFIVKDGHPIDTREDFNRLLKEANGAILELDGKPSTGNEPHESEAYEAVGRLVLRQCDVLIAVWDPKREEKTGGTRQIVRESLGLETPTVWISAVEEREPCLLLSVDPLSTERLDVLDERLKKLFLFSIETSGNVGAHEVETKEEEKKRKREKARRDQEIGAAKSFFEEPLPKKDLGFFFLWFRGAWSWEPFNKTCKRPEIKPNWHPLFDRNIIFRDQLQTNYDWADCLAKHYGGRYRSAFVATYCMGALAVLIAFLGFFFEESLWHYIFFTAELLLMIGIFSITQSGRNKGWHQRWMDYRLLAESLRQVQFLAPLGRITLALKVPAHLQPSDPKASWFNWYFRAIVRAGGMVPANFEPPYIEHCRQTLMDAVQGQIDYHSGNHNTLEIVSRRLHRTAQFLFVVAAIGCALHIISWKSHGVMSLAVNLATIVLPAFGGALAAISHHGEFDRLALRSEALAERLTNLKEELCKQGSCTSSDLGRSAQTFSEIMVGELLDWRFAFLDKNLDLH